MSYLVANPEDRFSRDEAHFIGYSKNLKNLETRKIAVLTMLFYHSNMHPKDTDRIANS